MLTAEELELRRSDIETSPELTALLARLVERAEPVLQRMPVIPRHKAVLTADGGVCPDDGIRLDFDPWSPTAHRCSRCGREFRGERHDWHWAYNQHLWLAERAAHLAAVAVFADRDDAARRANELLQAYRGYADYPNRDNVLGPSHLFFSTYLESIWIGNYLAAAMLLREGGMLDELTAEVVSAVADEAANIIGEFDEGLSNRQTWHNAALASIAVWFEDEELASRVVEGPTGIVAHLVHGFGDDGMWYEGDNYHLFALRGELLAMWWARLAGVDLLADQRLADRLALALRAPAETALPDFTFPARKDSRFGVSLAQPMYLEMWEIGLARVNASGERALELWDWLRRLYRTPAPKAQTFDSYLHEAGEPDPRAERSRADLSWWALLEMVSALPQDPPGWSPPSGFVAGQGLALFRDGSRYASLECGPVGGGHGHADRLNLIVHSHGEYWLPDLGTGSYVSPDLRWYRSTLAHNAPRLDSLSQPREDASCENFDRSGGWAWARGRFGPLTRTLVAGPAYLLDVVELGGTEERTLELPWHLGGQVTVPPGNWEPDTLSDEFARKVERLTLPAGGARVLRAQGANATMTIHLPAEGDVLRAEAPGPPGTAGLVPFYVLRARGKNLRLVSVLESSTGTGQVRAIRQSGAAIEVEMHSGTDRHSPTVEGWEIQTGTETRRLAGSRKEPPAFKPLIRQDRPLVATGVAQQLFEPPALNATLGGFETAAPLQLDHEDQYRRSEEPYAGPEEFSATAVVNWGDEALYLAIDVVKADVIARNPQAAPLRLDNEPDEIHVDGVQVYVRLPLEEAVYGFLVVPSTENGALLTRVIDGYAGSPDMVHGSWASTESGYLLTLAASLPGWSDVRMGDQIGFDVLVNQMESGRLRRAGQLVWSGGGGWVWLRGDRQDPARLGTLELR